MAVKVLMVGPVTAAGYARQQRKVDEAKARYDQIVADFHNDRGGENSTGEDRAADNASLTVLREAARHEWGEEDRVLKGIYVARSPNKECHARIGHKIEFKWLKPPNHKKKGSVQTVILGGINEFSDGDDLGNGRRGIPTINGISPLGQALKGSEVGEEVTILCPDGKENMIKIISIVTPRLALQKVA